MNAPLSFPSFEEKMPFLDQFILELVEAYHTVKINSWDELDREVKTFFTSERMQQMEALVPGWKKMASYSDGITLTHVICVFLGVYIMPEFQALTPEEQQIAKWIVLLHDLDKFHIHGKKDTMHAFRSGGLAARILPSFGFPITEKYDKLIQPWSELTHQAFVAGGEDAAPRPNNRKLPEILTGIDQLFGEDTPAALITQTALLHISLNVDPNYPTPSPLTETELKRFITPKLLPLLRVMMLGDTEGWALFAPQDRVRQMKEAREIFQQVEKLIAK